MFEPAFVKRGAGAARRFPTKNQLVRIFTLLLILSCAPFLHAENEIMAPGAQARKLAGGFQFTDGAACDAAGNV